MLSFFRPSVSAFFLRLVCWNGLIEIFLCRSSLGSTAMESCRLPELKYAIFSSTGRKAKHYRARSSFYRWPLSMNSYRGINISISIQLHDPYTIGKLSIRRVKICNVTRIGRKTEE